MNVKNNKRHQETMENIEKAFVLLLKDSELKEISVTELCKTAGIDRSTFYANYEGVSVLANEVAVKIERRLEEQTHSDGEFAWIFEHIEENREEFELYFKLGISRAKDDYKMIFFRTGAYSVAKMWFEDGCVESVTQMSQIIKREYDKLFT